MPTPTGTTFSRLSGISCTSATACTAVGDYINSTAADVALAERWDGTKWTVQSTAKPSFAQNYRLLAVSCPTLSACIAVGYDVQGSINYPLAERWDGTTWTALFATCAQAFVNVCALLAVSCTAANACAAVGYFDSASGELPVEEDWNGTSWAAEVPPGPSSNHADLFGVSCAAGFACTWVGWYKNGAGTLVTWAGHRAPNFNQYVDVTPNPAAATRIRMTAVSCTTTNQCMGVGDYSTAAAFIGRWRSATRKVAGHTLDVELRQAMSKTGPEAIQPGRTQQEIQLIARGGQTSVLILSAGVIPPLIGLRITTTHAWTSPEVLARLSAEGWC